MENFRDLFQTMAKRFGLLNKNCCSLDDVDISLVQSHILYEIDHLKQPSVQELANAMAMDITTLSRQIQKLVQMGLVRKTSYPEDRRIFILSLTEEGNKVATKIDAEITAYLEEVFSHMSEFEKETVLRSIRLLNECMAKSSVCCQPMYGGK
jgi:DNA-binding MarR family transcriptional regulator